MSVFKLMQSLNARDVVATWQGQLIRREQFVAHVLQLAGCLPQHEYAINLCNDRYLFLVSFTAAMVSKQTSLLPACRASKEIERIIALYPDSYCLTDEAMSDLSPSQFKVSIDNIQACSAQELSIDETLLATMIFTSGSTGVPQANSKTWKELVSSSKRVARRFALQAGSRYCLVATVPPQHMFGFELSIIYPLVNGICIYGGKPFYPQDIFDAVCDAPYEVILATTPIHLRAINSVDFDWPKMKFIISATAKLSLAQAEKTESCVGTQVREIYGCTEVGAIATRRPTVNKKWKLLDGYALAQRREKFFLALPDHHQAIELADTMVIGSHGEFELKGRNADFLNITGKRGSLSDLNIKLKSIAGVIDGVFLVPEPIHDERVRLVVMVVAPEVSEQDIIAALAQQVDPVFLPRLIIKLDALPYNETGKLPRHALLKLLHKVRKDEPLLESA